MKHFKQFQDFIKISEEEKQRNKQGKRNLQIS